ncbi:hypothetical protein GCM10007418_00320 [Halopseudomonas salina]|uniref:Uncharacterized protein n=1 Tax=Halopseudomonas salina TaxID=1323744 RepID=A0ABQ1NWM0_9GAMM|nr:hypothetical protein GCM10007418_00320 [Halopseudomonas salina]
MTGSANAQTFVRQADAMAQQDFKFFAPMKDVLGKTHRLLTSLGKYQFTTTSEEKLAVETLLQATNLSGEGRLGDMQLLG